MLQGPEWIESPAKRALELSILAGATPVLGIAALSACAAINHGLPTTSVVEVKRSLVPGEVFKMPKLVHDQPKEDLDGLLPKLMLDELPQAALIVKGSMSLFAPRATDPDYVERVFAAIRDIDLRNRLRLVRSAQKPGVISGWSVSSHAGNIMGIPDKVLFSKGEKLRLYAEATAHHDIYDYYNAGPTRDMRLLARAGRMAAKNYKKLVAANSDN